MFYVKMNSSVGFASVKQKGKNFYLQELVIAVTKLGWIFWR